MKKATVRSCWVWFGFLAFFVLYCNTGVTAQTSLKKISPTLTHSIEPTIEEEPEFGANWSETLHSDKKKYAVVFDWTALPHARGYAIQISKVPGGSPQKRITTYKTEWTFKSVTPGEWYVNLIAQNRNKEWSKIYYWKIHVGPQPKATPEADPEEVLSIRSKVENMMKRFSSNLEAEEENDILAESDEEDPVEKDIPVLKKQFQCDCEKSCKQMRSCAEANYLLFQCGCGHLDADDDSIPCENKCGNE